MHINDIESFPHTLATQDIGGFETRCSRVLLETDTPYHMQRQMGYGPIFSGKQTLHGIIADAYVMNFG